MTRAVSAALGSVGGKLFMTKNVATMAMADKQVISPPQMRMEMRAQLRRRRMPTPTRMPKMATRKRNSQVTLAMARAAPGKGTPLSVGAIRDTKSNEPSTKMAPSAPSAPKRMATMPTAVTAGWDFGLGSMGKAISPLESEWAGKWVDERAGRFRKSVR